MVRGRTIGEVARDAGIAATTLRYYEQIGLVPPPARLGGRGREHGRFVEEEQVQVLVDLETGLQQPGLLPWRNGTGYDALEALFGQHAQTAPSELGRRRRPVGDGDEEGNRAVSPPAPDPGGLSTPADDVAKRGHQWSGQRLSAAHRGPLKPSRQI